MSDPVCGEFVWFIKCRMAVVRENNIEKTRGGSRNHGKLTFMGIENGCISVVGEEGVASSRSTN